MGVLYTGFVKQEKGTNLYMQAFTLTLSLVAWVLCMVTLLNRSWRVNDVEGLVIDGLKGKFIMDAESQIFAIYSGFDYFRHSI